MKLLLLLLVSVLFIVSTTDAGEEVEFRPAEMIEYRPAVTDEENYGLRRRLVPFQLCLVCKCCAAGATCATMPCCFGIDCQLPNKPYGVCAFVPKTCNCTSCAS